MSADGADDRSRARCASTLEEERLVQAVLNGIVMSGDEAALDGDESEVLPLILAAGEAGCQEGMRRNAGWNSFADPDHASAGDSQQESDHRRVALPVGACETGRGSPSTRSASSGSSGERILAAVLAGHGIIGEKLDGTVSSADDDDEAMIAALTANSPVAKSVGVLPAGYEPRAPAEQSKCSPRIAAGLVGYGDVPPQRAVEVPLAEGDANSSLDGAESSAPHAKAAGLLPLAGSTAGASRRKALGHTARQRRAYEFSLKEEEDILDAIIATVTDKQSSVSGDLADGDEWDIEAVLERAEQVAASSCKNEMMSVLHTHEHHALKNELRHARGSVGWSTCVALCPTQQESDKPIAARVAVGTTLGLILLFSAKGVICGVCGSVDGGAVEQKGSVVSLAMARSGTTFLAGHEKGIIELWSTTDLTILRTLSDEFSAPVIRIRMLHPSPFRAVALDSDGHIKAFSFSKLMTKYVYRSVAVESSVGSAFSDLDVAREVIDGDPRQRGAVEAAQGHRHLMATASDDRIAVFLSDNGAQVDLRRLCLLSRIPLSASSAVLVQFLYSQEKNVLCIAWSTEVEIFHVAVGDGRDVLDDVTSVQVIKTPKPLQSMISVVGWCALLLDQDERMHVLDARAGTLVESQKLSGLEAACYSSKLCGIKYHGCLASDEVGTVIVLGKGRVFSCNLLSWTDRLGALVGAKRFTDALELAKGFAFEVAVGMVGLSSDPRLRRREVHAYIEVILAAYLKHVLDGTSDAVPAVCGALHGIVAYCAEIDALDVYLGPVMTFLRSEGLDEVGVYSLENAVLSGKIVALPDLAIRALFGVLSDEAALARIEGPRRDPAVDASRGEDAEAALRAGHDNTTRASRQGDGDSGDRAGGGRGPGAALSRGRRGRQPWVPTSGVDRAEEVLMRLEGSDEVLLEISEAHRLLRLRICVMSCHWHNYVDGLHVALDMVDRCHDGLPSEGPKAVTLTHAAATGVALDYVDATLAGYSIIGDVELPVKYRSKAKQHLLDEFERHPDTLQRVLRLGPHRILTTYDMVLNDNGTFSPWDLSRSKSTHLQLLFSAMVGNDLSARPWELERRPWPPYCAVDQLYQIATRLVVPGSVEIPDLQVFVERVAMHVVFLFQRAETPEKRREVQQTLCALLEMPAVAHFDLGAVREELESKRVARALAVTHCVRHDFVAAIGTYLSKSNNRLDPGLSSGVFALLARAMGRLNRYGDRDGAAKLREAVKLQICELVDENATALAQFVFEFLPEDHHEVINVLRSSSHTFLRYLEELIAKGDASVENDVSIQNSYISLLCELSPAAVYPYLHSRDMSISYDLQVVLKMVRRFRIADATIFLLEKTMMIDEAMSILVGTIAENMLKVRAQVVHLAESVVDAITDGSLPSSTLNPTPGSLAGATSDLLGVDEGPLKQAVDVGIDLCSKYHSQAAQSAGNWFSLLDLFTRPRRLLCDRQEQDQVALRSAPSGDPAHVVDGYADFNEIDLVLQDAGGGGSRGAGAASTLTVLSQPLSSRGRWFVNTMISLYTRYVAYILTRMVKQLDLSLVVGKIVEDHERERFGPFKPIIVDILDSLNFDVEVNRLCKACTDDDTLHLAAELHRTLSSGIHPFNELCGLCGLHLSEAAAAAGLIRFYSCGHGYHEDCCTSAHGLRECWLCRRDRIGERAASREFALFSPRVEEAQRRFQGKAIAGRPSTQEDEKHSANALHEQRGPDVATVMRKLRHTRAKLDGSRNYMDIMHSLLASAAAVGGADRPVAVEASAKNRPSRNLLLAPMPQEPASIGDLNQTPVRLADAITKTLTREEILEMFGITDFDLENDDGE